MAEAWETVKRAINQKLIGKDYFDLIKTDGKATYEELKRHFGESDEEDWAWYPSDTINNSFYLAFDMVISAGVLRVTGETDTARAFGR